MERPSFGERLRKAFGNAKQAEIARKMGVSEAAVKNYIAGRVPDADKLRLISTLTNCNLHWLLTGDDVPLPKAPEDSLIARIREIVREELASIDVDVIGPMRPVTNRDIMLAPHLGEVDGGEDEEELPRRRTG